jgi:hypothetical protein
MRVGFLDGSITMYSRLNLDITMIVVNLSRRAIANLYS